MGSVRVIVAGYGPIYRAGLCAVLPTNEQNGSIAVIGESGDLRKVRALIALLRPDVIVSDLSFPGEEFSPLRRLVAASVRSRLLVLTDRSDPQSVREALRDGASGYALRDSGKDDLIAAIRAVAAGGRYLDPRLGPLPFRRLDRKQEGLSEREGEVLELLALGHTNGEVAARLVISVRTVETHRSNIQRKLGVRTRAELARAVWREGQVVRLRAEQTAPA